MLSAELKHEAKLTCTPKLRKKTKTRTKAIGVDHSIIPEIMCMEYFKQYVEVVDTPCQLTPAKIHVNSKIIDKRKCNLMLLI